MNMKDEIKEAAQRILDVDIAADEWDEAPSLAVVIRDSEGVIVFKPIPISRRAWSAMETYQVVRGYADAANLMFGHTDATPFEPGEELLGVALFSEGWGVTAEKEGVSDLEEWTRAGNRLSDHPQGVEVKMVSVVLVDESAIFLIHARGNAEMPYSDEEEFGGRLMDALEYFLAAMRKWEPVP